MMMMMTMTMTMTMTTTIISGGGGVAAGVDTSVPKFLWYSLNIQLKGQQVK